MSLYKSLFITSIVISTLLINTPEVLAEHYINDIYIEETQYYIAEPATPIGGFSLVLSDYCDTLDNENEPKIALMSLVEENYTDLEVPSKNSFKSRMDWGKITNKSSKQWELQQEAYTDALALRCVDDRICTAVATYYAKEVGVKFDVYMKNGAIIPCIAGDIKDDGDTDELNRQHLGDNSVIEFIIDDAKYIEVHGITTYRKGDVSFAHPDFEGEIDFIRVYDHPSN